VGPDDPAQARALVAQLSRRPAQDSRLLTSARALMACASAEFVSVRVAEAIELLANARERATGRGYLQRRVLGEIEALTTMHRQRPAISPAPL
jgi:hypothetical protein